MRARDGGTLGGVARAAAWLFFHHQALRVRLERGEELQEKRLAVECADDDVDGEKGLVRGRRGVGAGAGGRRRGGRPVRRSGARRLVADRRAAHRRIGLAASAMAASTSRSGTQPRISRAAEEG